MEELIRELSAAYLALFLFGLVVLGLIIIKLDNIIELLEKIRDGKE